MRSAFHACLLGALRRKHATACSVSASGSALRHLTLSVPLLSLGSQHGIVRDLNLVAVTLALSGLNARTETLVPCIITERQAGAENDRTKKGISISPAEFTISYKVASLPGSIQNQYTLHDFLDRVSTRSNSIGNRPHLPSRSATIQVVFLLDRSTDRKKPIFLRTNQSDRRQVA